VSVRRALPAHAPRLFDAVPWSVIAAGKAAGPMLAACLACVPRPPRQAVCVAPNDREVLPPYVARLIGGHPVPTQGSVDGGAAALACARRCAPGDLLLILLSGGASALLAAPAPGLSLADKQATTGRLLRAGADIHALNAVRKHLSLVKGGRLAAASPAETICLAISDVVGDDPSVIGSGPAVADPTTFGDALSVLDRFGGRAVFPVPVVAWLERGARGDAPESPKADDPGVARASTIVIASQRDARHGAAVEARRRGYTVVEHPEAVVGEARTAGQALARRAALAIAGTPGPVCLLSAGETTVTVMGQGRGGRNQELALAAAVELPALPRPAVVASVGTDGIDGPTDAAGAIADATTLARAAAAGLPAPAQVLDDNDAYAFFAPLGDLVMTGPTGTNVGDVQVVVAGPDGGP
jgi:hydroxypyruvate reductase